MPHLTYIVTDPMTVKIYLKPQIEAMMNRKWRVSIVCGGEKMLLPARNEIHGAEIYHVPMQREINPVADSLSLIRLFLLLIRLKPTVVNAGTPKAGLLGMVASHLANVPFRIYQLHGLRLETATGWRRKVLLVTERLACWNAHKVLCVSRSLKDKVTELGICRPEKVLVLGSGSCVGIQVADYAPTPERLEAAAALKKDLNIEPHEPVVGFVGRLTRDKGIVELLEAFELVRQKFRSAHLLLVGPLESGDPIPMHVRLKIDAGEYIRHIKWTDDTLPFLQFMDVLVLPTHREGLPGVLLEAAAAGIPIVATEATGVNDVVVDRYTGLISPVGDVQPIAQNISEVLLNPGLANSMKAQALRKIETEFSRHKVLQQLESFYEDSVFHRKLSGTAENCAYAEQAKG